MLMQYLAGKPDFLSRMVLKIKPALFPQPASVKYIERTEDYNQDHREKFQQEARTSPPAITPLC